MVIIPDSIGSASNLQYLVVAENSLRGRLPSSVAHLQYLSTLRLNKNSLSGPIGPAFDPANQISFRTIDLSNNIFTGTIADSIRLLSGLKTLILASNCFTGTSSPQVCLAASLVTLDLDGASCGAASCQQRIFPRFKPYTVLKPLSGTLLSCVWALQRMQPCTSVVTISLVRWIAIASHRT